MELTHFKAMDNQAGAVARTDLATCKRSFPALFRLLVAFVLCMGLMLPIGLPTKTAFADDPSVDLGMVFPAGSSYVSTSMGRNPAGETSFALSPADSALADYQTAVGDPSKTKGDMMNAWLAGITSVKLDDKTLTANQFANWMNELTTPEADASKLPYYWISVSSSNGRATLELPVALFDTTEAETDTKTVTIESTGFDTVTGDVTYRNIGAEDIMVRVLDKPADEGGTILYSKALSRADLEALPVQSEVLTSAACGMAGLRAYMSEGVSLPDILDRAGVTFSSGMTMKLRTTDSATTNDGNGDTEPAYIFSGTFTYDDLMGVDRYYYPAMWDDTTTFPELGGATIYDTLKANGNTYFATDPALAAAIGQTKVKVDAPILAWAWNEGVVRWDGVEPSEQTWGDSTYNQYTSHESFRFLYGMKAQDDGSIAADYTTFSNTYGVFGIDIISPEYVPATYDITYHLDGGVNAATNPAQYAYSADSPLALAAPTKQNYTFAGWFSDEAMTVPFDSIPADTTGALELYAKYTPKTFAITYNLDDGVNAAGNPGGYTYSPDSSLALAAPTRENYTFAGWFLDAAMTVPFDSIPAGNAGDLVLYAKWVENPGASGTTGAKTSAVSKVSSTSLAKTGDNVPIVPLACVAGAGLAVLAVCLLRMRRRRESVDGMHSRLH